MATSFLKWPPGSPVPSLNPSQTLPVQKKSPILLSLYLISVHPFCSGDLDLAQSSSPHVPLYLSALYYYFQNDKKYTTIKSLMLLRVRAGPKVTLLFSSALRPTFHSPPLIAPTHRVCHSALTFPSHTRYCLNLLAAPTWTHLIQSPLLCTHTGNGIFNNNFGAVWLDTFPWRDEGKAKAAEVKDGKGDGVRERTCVDEGI